MYYLHKIVLLLLLSSTPLYVYAKTPLEQVSLQLQWKDQFEFAGFYAAKEKGFYEEAGLDVTFKPFSSQINIIDEVLNHKATYGVAYNGIIARYLEGAPLVFLANFFKQSPLVLVTQSPYKLPSDLKGKTIMASNNIFTLLSPLMMLKKFDLSRKDFTVVPPSFNIQDFIDKKVDAVVIFLSNETYYLNKAGVAYNILNPGTYGVPSYDLNLFTTKQELKEHPGRVGAFREASIKGWEYAIEHKDEIIQLILEKYNSQNKSYAALKYEADQLEDMILPSIYPVGSIDPTRVKYIAESMIAMEILPTNTSLDLQAFIYKVAPKNIKLSPKERNYLLESSSITYCADPQWMPFSAIENNSHRGMDADFINFFSEKLNHPFTLIPTVNWEESMEKGIHRECDVLSMIMETPKRTQYFNFTKSFVSTPIILATTVDKIFIESLDNIHNETVGIVKGYVYRELLSYHYPHLKIMEVANIDEGLKLVAEGTLYAFIDNLTTVGYLIQKKYIGTLKISAKVDMQVKFGFAVRKDDPLLLSILNKLIDTLDKNTKEEIYNRWNKVTFSEGINKTLFSKIFLGFMLFLLFIYYHYRKMYKINKKLHEHSIKDTLSGLFNRRYIETQINKEHGMQREYAYFSLILLDIDNFKKVNDTYGHDMGDKVIQKISNLIQQESPQNAVISRWGGEEFLIFCPSYSSYEVIVYAERLRKKIEDFSFDLDWCITCSFGVAQYDRKESNYSNYIQKVDHALLRAKAEGKNRVVLYKN